MKNKISFNVSDRRDPQRAEKFFAVLEKRGANPTDVLQKLIDAFIESDGRVHFPVRLEEAPPGSQ